MPGNLVNINSSDDLEWYVGDSKMEELITALNRIGYKTNSENDAEESNPEDSEG